MGGVEVYGGRGGGVIEGWRCVGEVRCVVGEVESMGGVEQCEEWRCMVGGVEVCGRSVVGGVEVCGSGRGLWWEG